MAIKTEFLSIRTDHATKERLAVIGQVTGMSQSDIIRTAIRLLFEDINRFKFEEGE